MTSSNIRSCYGVKKLILNHLLETIEAWYACGWCTILEIAILSCNFTGTSERKKFEKKSITPTVKEVHPPNPHE